jgi:bifunctional UDP-N-acetylglucosamine pyrophosphorylase/glucosamine-1-phosphate N-acetyltransferase
LNIVILAAGLGKRMRSARPKVLQPLAGRPLLAHVIATARELSPTRLIVVHGHGAELVRGAFANEADIVWVAQEQQLGTGHAVAQAIPELDDKHPTLILYGDVPLTTRETLERLNRAAGSDLALLTVGLDDPTGYGRIVREGGAIRRIVEEKDASADERAITEVNTGMLVAQTGALKRWLGQLSNRNAQGEYYLTDIIGFAAREGVPIHSAHPGAVWETLGVNDKVQLAELERRYQSNLARTLMERGVTVIDPARIDVRGVLTCGSDVSLDVGCIFSGRVVLDQGVQIGAHCVIREAHIGAGSVIEPFSHIDGAMIGERCRIGPYARVRPGSEFANDVHIGNFVEVKNSILGSDSKANHLAYVGDSTLGARVNVGAGTITCNYDGANKHRTVIDDDVHIGSDTQLVAPVHVGAGATIGAGTTVWKDVAAGALVTNQKTQNARSDWTRPTKPKR